MTRIIWAVGLAVVALAMATSVVQREHQVAGCPPTYTGDLTIWDAARPECPPLFMQGRR